jgi:peptidoglycan/LPS O-acetylase OafA/YrhL
VSWSYRPALDGVRTIAVYLVVLFHSGLGAVSGGFVGVDVFFVLSGFLITNVLLSDVDEVGRIRFGRFYARRVRRLLPAAVVAVAVTCLVFLVTTSVVRRVPLVRDAQSALLYVANWRFLGQQNDYFATDADRSPFLHFWSLGIEEQFYVVFPLLLLLLVRSRRWRPWAPAAGLGALLLVSVALQAYWAGADPNHAYYGTDARAYQLLAGAVLAVALRTWTARPPAAVARAAAWVGLGCVVLLGSGLVDTAVSHRGFATVAATVLLVGGLVVTGDGGAHALLSRRTPVYLGRISYATYLWHWPVLLVVQQLVDVGAFALALTGGVLATGLAALSYELLEMPVRRSASLDRFRWATVAVGVAVCALVAAVFVPPVLEDPRRPQLVASTAVPARGGQPVVVPRTNGGGADISRARPEGRHRVPDGLDWQALATDVGPQRTCPADRPRECVVVRGGAPHVLLVGDSNARMMTPAFIRLARERGFTLSLNVLSGCPWQAHLTNSARPPEEQASCTAARDDWYRRALPVLQPDVVVLVSFARDDESVYGYSLHRTGGSSERLPELLLDTTNETLDEIVATGAHALVMNSIITSDFDPLECLAQATYVEQCAVTVPIERPISDSFYETADVRSDAVFTFDINPIVCPHAPVCEAMIGRLNVWRNVNHFGTALLVRLRDRIWSAVEASGALSG